MKSLRERTEIQQAFLDGAEIEYKYFNVSGCRVTDQIYQKCVNEPIFNWTEADYRIKPKPMVEYIAFYRDVRVGMSNDRDSLTENIESFDRIVKMVEQPE